MDELAVGVPPRAWEMSVVKNWSPSGADWEGLKEALDVFGILEDDSLGSTGAKSIYVVAGLAQKSGGSRVLGFPHGKAGTGDTSPR